MAETCYSSCNAAVNLKHLWRPSVDVPKRTLTCVMPCPKSVRTLHSLITFHHANMRGSRLRICVSRTVCHPRVMSRCLPHLTLTSSTSSLSPTSPVLQSSSSTHPSVLSHDSMYTLQRFTAELRFLGSPISHMERRRQLLMRTSRQPHLKPLFRVSWDNILP